MNGFFALISRRIEGAPNFRRVPLTLRPISSQAPGSDAIDFAVDDSGRGRMVCGRLVFKYGFFVITFY